jgi:hypothetical protein
VGERKWCGAVAPRADPRRKHTQRLQPLPFVTWLVCDLLSGADMIRFVAPLFALAALPALATAPRIAVLPFAGSKAGYVREQLLAELCDQVVCVPPADIKGRKGPDWSKVQAQNVDAVVKGTIVKSGGAAQLKLQVLDASGHTPWKTAIKLDRRGELGPTQDRKVLVALERRLHTMKRPDGAEADQAFQSRRDSSAKAAPLPPASASPAPAGPTQVASKQSAAEVEQASVGTPSDTGRRFKPLPPELLNFTPRI